ncbi:hypothetical protein E2C01_087980 [Portunus trituberculatus]|uniref:Secreted protein n=1 Tax=Portunus trituberculatus TaxID=210409 RepID=A0A5B7JIP2_PORTR|nr:hypothetical protein [Portunus trituberculatus]
MCVCVCVAGIHRWLCDAVPYFLLLGGPHCEHPGPDGGTVCLPSHPPSPLVWLWQLSFRHTLYTMQLFLHFSSM